MRKFLSNGLGFGAVIVLLIAIVNFFVLPNVRLYTFVFRRHHGRVVEACVDKSMPRLFLLGGSNLGYGIENDIVEDAVKGRYRFVNMGLDAGMGLGLQLSLIDPYLRTGDCIVIASEYAGYDDLWNGGLAGYVYRCDVLNRTVLNATFSERWSSCNPRSIRHYVMEKVRRLEGKEPTFRPPTPVTVTNAVQGASPFESLRQSLNPRYAHTPVSHGSNFVMSDDVYGRLVRLRDEMIARNVRVLVTAPAYDSRHYALHKDEISLIWSKLTDVFGESVISKPETYVYDLECMCDSPWHVNRETSVVRTRTLVEELCPFL